MNRNDLAERFVDGHTKGRTRNMFIEGDTIYSYGTHFPIAKRLTATEFLFNSRSYSSSTRCHKAAVSRAIHLKGFIMWDMPNCEIEKITNALFVKAEYLQNKILEARKPGPHIKELETTQSYWGKCKKRFKLKDKKLDYELSLKDKDAIIAKIVANKFDESLGITHAA